MDLLDYSFSIKVAQNLKSFFEIIAYVCSFFGVIYSLFYFIKLMLIEDYKTKYDYIIENEINYLLRGSVLILIGIIFHFNIQFDFNIIIWFFIRVLLSIFVGLMLYFILNTYFLYYYPFFVEKRLKILRTKPRISPAGNKMKLLREDEEDIYLDEGMQAEEKLFSADYDVWIDDLTGYTKIEKYNGRLRALICPECHYQTLKITGENIIIPSTEDREGEIEKKYECIFCAHKHNRIFKISKLKKEYSDY